MSGHSKFANIKHKKEKNDAAKGKIFTIIGREIAVAVKEGGADPANNSRLRDVIAKAKANNMPNDTIDRGIKKAAGDANAVNYEFVSYEGYGPNGTAIIPDDLMMTALDAGAEDFSEEEDSYEVITDPDSFSEVRQKLEDEGIPMASAEVTMIPQNWVELTDETAIKNLQKTLDLLEEVQGDQNEKLKNRYKIINNIYAYHHFILCDSGNCN